MSVLVTTVPGLEDYVVKEAEARSGSSVRHSYDKLSGRILMDMKFPSIAAAKSFLVKMRTIENAYYLLDAGEVGPRLSDLRSMVGALRLEELLSVATPETSIAVEAIRSGNHEYTSTAVASAVGDAAMSFLEKRGVRAIINLSDPDVVIGAHVIGNKFFLGIKVTRSTIRDRDYRVKGHPASLNPIIAFAMIMMAEPMDGETICDLTCGGGTIPAEAAHYWRSVRSICIDVSPEYCHAARINLAAAGGESDLLIGDSTTRLLRPLACDHVIFNPPYGIRIKTEKPIRTFYRELMTNAISIAKRNVVVITGRRKLVADVVGWTGKTIERRIEQGGMYSSIFTIMKEKDEN